MLEIIIVIAIVTIVAFMTGRSFYQIMTGKNDGCGCSGNCLSRACKDFKKTNQGQDKNQ
jgi:hypothetical protein